MAFTYGFYNSLNGDRKYDAMDISMMFDGIIQDGVYATVGESMIVKTSELDNTVIVQPGRAWFNHTWSYNDSDKVIDNVDIDGNEVLSPFAGTERIDALILDIHSDDNYRENKIVWLCGTASTSPEKPTLTNEEGHYQYPLCYVHRYNGQDVINQEDITNTIGTDECPFVTGILETLSVDELLLQWQDQWDQFIIDYESSADEWKTAQQEDFNSYYKEFKLQMNSFETAMGQEFTNWFNSIRDILDDNTAGNLQNEIDEITETEFNRYYNLFNSTTSINDTTEVITTVTAACTATTKFSTDSDGNDVITTTLNMNEGSYNYIKTTTIKQTATGSAVESTYTKKGK
jgi:hypothetical protein